MQIMILGKAREYEEGTSLLAISQDVVAEYASPIMLAMVNGKLKELRKLPKDGDVVEFVTMNTENGIRTYRRGFISKEKTITTQTYQKDSKSPKKLNQLQLVFMEN